jgi:hypothetical protein
MRELSQELDRLSQATQKAISEWMELAKQDAGGPKQSGS